MGSINCHMEMCTQPETERDEVKGSARIQRPDEMRALTDRYEESRIEGHPRPLIGEADLRAALS